MAGRGCPIQANAMALKDTLLRIFTWWNGQTLNTQVWTALNGAKVGELPDAETLTDADRWILGRLDEVLAHLSRAEIEDVVMGAALQQGSMSAADRARIAATIATGVAGVDLNQSGLRYFDTHHTPDDTLERVDPEQLRQNVAAWTTMLAVVADAPEEIGPVPRP